MAVRQGAVLGLLPAEAAVQLRAEAAELPRRAEAAVAELPRRAEAAYQRRRYPRCPVTARQEACDREEAWRCWRRGRLLRP